ncbi:MAG: HGGxSTG domain-containing protein [Dongiaceae bacterium]
MPHVASPSPLALELAAGHALMMQCGASAVRILDLAKPADAASFDLRAGEEATRMAGLSSRLMRHTIPGFRLLGRLPAEARAAALPPAGQAAVAPAAAAPAANRKFHAAPEARRGCLRNGNPAGDFLAAPRCGARTRTGGCCRQPAMANGRCRLHGGRSTGPRTPAGLARCRTTRLVHGYRGRAHLALRHRAVHTARRLRALTASLTLSLSKGRGLSAGHGVHRPDSSSPVGARGARPPSAAAGVLTDGPRPADPRARAARPYNSAILSMTPVSAGHGVHRSDSIHRRDAELALGPAKGRTGGRRAAESGKASLVYRPSLRLCVSAVNLLSPPLGMGSIAPFATICVHPPSP